ncbi:unnamed protein product [Dracunculus medinensis]|uniref:Very-long-chain 3-oxoacyl-CoA reductase n=1 Tax=Dracunculus medinensis TaxID=318479 RepID=A0A0N4UMI2_DRAME|nr:unnamed protein product [Dracunculus medinensis]
MPFLNIEIIGWATVAYIIYRWLLSFYKIIYPYLIAKPINLLEAAGSRWAVVTGGSDGIGKQYAFELARRGFSIVLIARSKSKLEDVKRKIQEETGVEMSLILVQVIVFDFSSANLEEYEKKIFPELKNLDIGILINNVGVSYEYPELLHKVDGGLNTIANVNIVNSLPCVLLCSVVLPQMLERNKGIIVNVSSAAAYLQTIMLAAYSAAKKSRPSLFAPSPENFVKSAISTIGITSETTGCLAHQVQVLVSVLSIFLILNLSAKHSSII